MYLYAWIAALKHYEVWDAISSAHLYPGAAEMLGF